MLSFIGLISFLGYFIVGVVVGGIFAGVDRHRGSLTEDELITILSVVLWPLTLLVLVLSGIIALYTTLFTKSFQLTSKLLSRVHPNDRQ